MTASKACSKCDETKSLDLFHKNNARNDGRQPICKACASATGRAWRDANSKAIAARAKTYYQSNCELLAAKKKAYRQSNPEVIAARQKSYYQDNREKIAARQKAYREGNPEVIATRGKAYYEANREKIAARQKAWGQNNSTVKATRGKAYREANRESLGARLKTYRQSNRELLAAKQKSYYQYNREKIAAYAKAYSQANPEKHAQQNARRRASKLGNGVFVVTAKEIAKFYASPCAYCGVPSKHIDHVIPLARGGTHSVGNLVGACASCNLSKSSRFITEWKKAQLAIQNELEKSLESGALIPSERLDHGKVKARPELFTLTPQQTDNQSIGRVQSTAEDRQK